MAKLSTGFADLDRGLKRVVKGRDTFYYARVVDIILDESHPDYIEYGRDYSIGAIKFTPIDRPLDESDSNNFPIAYPLDPSIKKLPLKNEIVVVTAAPSRNISINSSSEYTLYYTTTVNLWNSSNNPAPSFEFDGDEVDYGYEYTENINESTFLPHHGDVILQGRHGQGLRFTGARSPKSPFANKQNANNPLTLLTNGTFASTLDGKPSLEDINQDSNSIYLASNHSINLEQSRDKYAGAKTRPILAKNYNGNQVVVNSGRLYFNTKEEDILFSSQGNFGVTSNNIFLDGVDYIGLDATKIYLGEKAVRFELQPILLGNQTELFLYELLTALTTLSNSLIEARTANQIAIPALNGNGITLKATLQNLLNQINPNGQSQLKSKKVFTE
jgi:hypothetical protein